MHVLYWMTDDMYILYIMFPIIALFIITLFALLYVNVGISLAYEKHLHDRIISLSEDVLSHKTSLATTFFIEVAVSI